MSKLIDITVTCPQCGQKYKTKVFRTLWGDGGTAEQNNLSNDNVNVVECPHCNYSFRAPLAMMYVDCKKGFAVWWEPIHDSGIDNETIAYSNMFGAESYYAKAPRIQDWEDFKDTVKKYYTGELKANPITKFDINALKGVAVGKKSEKSGCLGFVILLIGSITSLITGLNYLL